MRFQDYGVRTGTRCFASVGTTLDVQFADLLDEFGDDPQGRFWDQLPALSPLLR
jgi:hypothetical protein